MTYLVYLLVAVKAPLNLATWVLWLTIDGLLITSLIRAKKPYEIMIPFAAGTAIITAIAVYNFLAGSSSFLWGYAETVTVLVVIISLVVWKMKGDGVGAVMTTLAMVIAGIPTWVDAYQDPTTQSVLFWSLSAASCALSYFGSPKGGRFMPGSGALSNGLIIVLALRQYM